MRARAHWYHRQSDRENMQVVCIVVANAYSTSSTILLVLYYFITQQVQCVWQSRPHHVVLYCLG
jgi:hypothetical protein